MAKTIVLIQEMKDGVLYAPEAYDTEAEAQDRWDFEIPPDYERREEVQEADRFTFGGVELFRWRIEI